MIYPMHSKFSKAKIRYSFEKPSADPQLIYRRCFFDP